MKNPDCTVVVTSCDEYADVLPPFVELWRMFWPDCPFETVLATQTDSGVVAGFDRTILAGEGKCWSERMAAALDQIATPYVLLLMDDYYLSEEVDTARILDLLARCKHADALNLRMNPKPPYAKKNHAYAISCQAGFWNRGFLLSLVAKTKTAWDFERNGSFMFDESDSRPLLVTDKKEFPFVDAVHKGCWDPVGLKLLSENAVAYAGVRMLPTLKVRVVEGLKKLVFALFPTNWIVRVQNALMK